MLRKLEIIKQIVNDAIVARGVAVDCATAFAPVNIALCKYWGKRDENLHLPVTNSLSVSLAGLGTTTSVAIINDPRVARDIIESNNKILPESSQFYQRVSGFLELFRSFIGQRNFHVKTSTNVPVAAGFASSASGFAALTKALNKLLGWQLPVDKLSILARLGSGSACRSMWPGFVEWVAGNDNQLGMDCHGVPISMVWPELAVGLLVLAGGTKNIDSRSAMQRCHRSPFYAMWPQIIAEALPKFKQAIKTRDFALLGSTAEENALAMHAIMMTSKPAVLYGNQLTLAAITKVQQARSQGVQVYFTQDAGPNLKLLFLASATEQVTQLFPELQINFPFGG